MADKVFVPVAGKAHSKGSAAGPRWIKTTKTYADLAAAALTNDIEVYSLPAGNVIHACKLKHSASFTGGTIATYTLTVGIAGNLLKYLTTPFNTFQAPSNTAVALDSVLGTENHGAATSIRLSAISTVGLLNAATQGVVDVWLLVSEAL